MNDHPNVATAVLPLRVEQLPFYEYHHPLEARYLAEMARQVREQPFASVGRRIIVVNLNAFLNGEDLVFSFATICNVSLGFRSREEAPSSREKNNPLIFLYAQLGNEHQPAMVCLDECFAQVYQPPPKPLLIKRTHGDHLLYNLLLHPAGASPTRVSSAISPYLIKGFSIDNLVKM
jgi:hypothetical protein